MEKLTPPTLDALTDFIGEAVEQHFKGTGRPLDGASLANQIRTHFAEFSYDQLGISKLADAVRKAEEKGLVRRKREVLHLAVVPGTSVGPALVTSAEPEGVSVGQYVRPEIWRAVVFLPHRSNLFFDHETGGFIDGQDTNTTDLDSSPRYAKLDTVGSEDQREWVREFFEETPNFQQEALKGDRWWAEFAGWLKQQDRQMVAKWNRCRAKKVCAFLKKWARDNKVPITSLFVPRISSRPASASVNAGEVERIREAVARIVGEMELEDLKDLRLPLKDVLRYFRVK